MSGQSKRMSLINLLPLCDEFMRLYCGVKRDLVAEFKETLHHLIFSFLMRKISPVTLQNRCYYNLNIVCPIVRRAYYSLAFQIEFVP